MCLIVIKSGFSSLETSSPSYSLAYSSPVWKVHILPLHRAYEYTGPNFIMCLSKKARRSITYRFTTKYLIHNRTREHFASQCTPAIKIVSYDVWDLSWSLHFSLFYIPDWSTFTKRNRGWGCLKYNLFECTDDFSSASWKADSSHSFQAITSSYLKGMGGSINRKKTWDSFYITWSCMLIFTYLHIYVCVLAHV